MVFLENVDFLRHETFGYFPSTASHMLTSSHKMLPTHRVADRHVDDVLAASLLNGEGTVAYHQVAHVDETALIDRDLPQQLQ